MNFIKVLDKLADKEQLTAMGSRRDSFLKMKSFGKDMALASIPFALAATNNKTKAATMAMPSAAQQATPLEILEFALTLEYLEEAFYQTGVSTAGLIPSPDMDVYQLIASHESAHVAFLKTAVSGMGGNTTKPNFDFTAGGMFNTFTDYQTFALLAQGFEDTGVRAYKGQAGGLADSNTLLTYALQIHSVEARHASQIRRMRGEKGWIIRDNSPAAALDAVYAGEAQTTQAGVDVTQFIGGIDAGTAAFDEPLSMADVNAIAGLFIA